MVGWGERQQSNCVPTRHVGCLNSNFRALEDKWTEESVQLTDHTPRADPKRKEMETTGEKMSRWMGSDGREYGANGQ